MLQVGKDGLPYHDLLEWAYEAQIHGVFCLRALILSIERGDARLPIDPQAWDNTMAALEWMVTQHLQGSIYRVPPFAQEDLERVRRVHTLGTEALSVGEMVPELCPLADQCLSSMAYGWRTVSPDFPVCYPPPEEDAEDMG